MNDPIPFAKLFPSIYPERRTVLWPAERGLVGVLLKSVMFHRNEETLLCRGLVLRTNRSDHIHTTVCFKVANLTPVVGYDLDLRGDEGHGSSCHDNSDDDDGSDTEGESEGGYFESWPQVRRTWSRHFAHEPAHVTVLHDDIKRAVNAKIFPLKSIASAKKYMESVRGALTFGDFCPDTGYYAARDGNTPALCCDVMFGRLYFLPEEKCFVSGAAASLHPHELIYDHEMSEAEAKLFDTKHAPYFYRAACLDIETVVNDAHRDSALRTRSFGHRFPYCTEGAIASMNACRERLVKVLREAKANGFSPPTVPALAGDMPGQQHEITCVSLVVLNTHVAKRGPEHHRKRSMVLYNKRKVKEGRFPDIDSELSERVGVDPGRVAFHPCDGELRLLEKTVALLHRHSVELLYVYNAEFDVRVLEQRVHFHAESGSGGGGGGSEVKRGEALLQSWRALFVTRSLSETLVHSFQFESVRYLEMYKEMLNAVGSELSKAKARDPKLSAIHVEKFNKSKAKLGHFKMISCGMVIVDLYRMATTRSVKFACSSMKLNDVAPFLISRDRELRGRPPKDARKLQKLSDVAYSQMDDMIHGGGKGLFAVLLYNLVDSQLCARIAKVLRPASALFHRCRITLNIDVVVHGRGDAFGGFVQSIHAVQLPQLKYVLDNLRAKAGPASKELSSRERWDPRPGYCAGGEGEWKGGAVCEPLTGLHYAGPGMGLELAFDFASMYPAIMCALNISPETTIPWPATGFGHDLSGWVCYSWESEGFGYASLIMKYDPERRAFVREPSVFSSAVEYYLDMRSALKQKLEDPALCNAERAYYKMQEGECKVMANSFYGTAPFPCGPLISAHGRQQIAAVNRCVSSFYRHACPVLYGDTDSVMAAVGYGPADLSEDREEEIECATRTKLGPGECWDGDGDGDEDESGARLKRFAALATEAIARKCQRVGSQVPAFLAAVHATLVEDALERMYVIGKGNVPVRLTRDPAGGTTEQGYPVYVAKAPDSEVLCDVTGPFVKGRRVRLEYENSSSVYCHVAKKTYVALTHTLDGAGQLASPTVKMRGLSAVKSMRSPSDSAVTDSFVACVMRGDCLKLERSSARCFSTCPWHALAEGDLILYPDRELSSSTRDLWLDGKRATDLLVAHAVLRVIELRLEKGFSAVSVVLAPAARADGSDRSRVVVRSLYKDGLYCMNHMFSAEEAVLRDLLACRASELIASKLGAGFFPWTALVKSAKNKHFQQQTLRRMGASTASVKTTYVEIVRTWLQKITGLSTKPVECSEFYKCSPCEATLCRYPINLQATTGCITAMFGGSLACEAKRGGSGGGGSGGGGGCGTDRDKRETGESRSIASLRGLEPVPHPYQPNSMCYPDSRVLLAHRADRELVNRSSKLVAHCVIDYCLPRRMYEPWTDVASILERCRAHLLALSTSVKARLKRATAAFNSIMNNCPKHMIPVCGAHEMQSMQALREIVHRLPGEKLHACLAVVEGDLSMAICDVYNELCGRLGRTLEELERDGVVRFGNADPPLEGDSADGAVSLILPTAMLTDAKLTRAATVGGALSLFRSEASERALVDLAGTIYQTILLLQICSPAAFQPAASAYSGVALRIMPYSKEDADVLDIWLRSFKSMEWLKPAANVDRAGGTVAAALASGKRCDGAPSKPRHGQVTYHCSGCKDFYRNLFANRVSSAKLLAYVYGSGTTRIIGRCVNETWWLS